MSASFEGWLVARAIVSYFSAFSMAYNRRWVLSWVTELGPGFSHWETPHYLDTLIATPSARDKFSYCGFRPLALRPWQLDPIPLSLVACSSATYMPVNWPPLERHVWGQSRRARLAYRQ